MLILATGNPMKITEKKFQVELVGGPLCGTKVDWPPEAHIELSFQYTHGVAVYRYEGNLKAIYVRG